MGFVFGHWSRLVAFFFPPLLSRHQKLHRNPFRVKNVGSSFAQSSSLPVPNAILAASAKHPANVDNYHKGKCAMG
eukprot:124427-Amphidinium_carterae.1